MKGRIPNHAGPSELNLSEAEMRRQGLRVLARLIAGLRIREVQTGKDVVSERNKGMSPKARGNSREASNKP